MGFLRRLRSELRLYSKRAILIVALLELCVVAAALMAGYDYAVEQTDVADRAVVNSCEQLYSAGVPEADCDLARASQAYSKAQLGDLAARIGPPAGSAVTLLGTVAFTLGHLSTLVGLIGLAILASTTLGEESRVGVARFREREALRSWTWPVRVGGIVSVWFVVSTIVALGALAVVQVFVSDDGRFGVDARSGASFLMGRLVGGTLTVGVFAVALVAIRSMLSTRPRWFLAAVTIVGAMTVGAATQHQLFPPSNLGWASLHFEGDLMSYLDRFPLNLYVSDGPVSTALLAGLAVLCGVLTLLYSTIRTHRDVSSR